MEKIFGNIANLLKQHSIETELIYTEQSEAVGRRVQHDPAAVRRGVQQQPLLKLYKSPSTYLGSGK